MNLEQVRIKPLEDLKPGLGEPEIGLYVEAIDYEVYFPARVFSVAVEGGTVKLR